MYKTKNNYEHFSQCGYSTSSNLGDKCVSNDDCTSQFCHNNICTRFEGFSDQQNLTCGGPVTNKKSVGLCCENNNDCFSQNCVNGYCMLNNNQYNKKIESFSNCNNNRQVKKSLGLSCSNNDDCFSNNCQNKKCMPKMIEKFCDNQIIKKSLGLQCTTNSDCFSNNCKNGTCTNSENPLIERFGSCNQCQNDSDCQSGSYCNNNHCVERFTTSSCGSYTPNTSCQNDNDCPSGTCNNGQCVERFSSWYSGSNKKTVKTNSCSSDNGCLNSYYCCPTDKICKKRK